LFLVHDLSAIRQRKYSAAVIVSALGCPRQTAYAWLDGSRKPPAWQQTLFLAVIAKESKKRNKDLHATPSKRVGKAER
jgi:hypothetical protein